MQEAVVLIQGIKEAWLSSQIEDIEDESGAVFEACGETAEDEADKVDETELPELSAEEVIKMGLPAVPKLDFKIINFPNKLTFCYSACW